MSKKVSFRFKNTENLFTYTSSISIGMAAMALITGFPSSSTAEPAQCAHLNLGDIVRNPIDVGNKKAIDFTIHADSDRNCYLSPDPSKKGRLVEAPTIRFKPNRNKSTITLNLKNQLPGKASSMAPTADRDSVIHI